MKNILLFLIFHVSISLPAQDCSKELLRQKPGTWKAGIKGSVVNVTPTDLIKEKNITAGIHKMISSKYKPTGCQLLFATSYGKSALEGETWIADPYSYTMYILRYLCDQQSPDKFKYYVDTETPTTVNIHANVINFLSILYAKGLDNDFRGYLKLTKKPEKKDGFYFMGEEKVDYNSPIYEYRWLITYNDTLPFSYISRKEYLLIQRKRLEKDVIENPGEKAFLQQYFKNIDDHLNQSEIDLSETAICMWNEEQRFEKFVEEGTKGSFIAIKPNLGYYNKKLPKSTPQFFTVVYKIFKNDAVFVDNIEAIKKAVDFTTLKNLLGK